MLFAANTIKIRQVLHLAIPLIIANISMIGMEIIDTIMAGQVSAIDLAGLAIGGNIWIMAEMTLGGVISGLTPRIARFVGANKPKEITHEVEQGLMLSLCIGILLMGLLLLLVPYVPLIGAEPTVTKVGQQYMTIIAFSLPASAVTWVIFGLAEGHAMTRFAVISSLIALGLNAILDYIFVFGTFGFPKMGGVGCALTTTIIYWMWAASCLIYMQRNSILRKYKVLHYWPKLDWGRWGAILALGLPISMSLLAEEGFFSFSTLLIAPLGAITLGAHQITLQITALALMLSLGVGQATAIRAANSIGQNKVMQVRSHITAGLQLVLFICLSMGLLTYFGYQLIPNLFSNDSDIVLLTSSLMLFAPIFLLFDALQVWTAQSLRGFEDTKIPMIFQISAFWLIGFPLGYSLGRTEFWGESYGIYGFWGGLLIGVSLCCVLLGWRLSRKVRLF